MGSSYNIRFILESINQYKYWVVGLFIIAIIGAIDLSLRPYLLKVMLDKITVSEPNMLFTTLLFPVILYILISIIEVIIFRFYDFFWLKLKPNLQKYIGIKLLNRMMAHSADLYENHFAGSLVNKINDVIGGIPNIIKICVDQIFGNTLSMVIATITLYYVSPKIAIVFILWAVIFIIISFKFAAVAGDLSKVTAEVRSKLVGYKVDALSNITSIRLFTGKETEVQRFNYAFNRLISAMQKRDWYFLKINALQGGSFVAYQAICLWWLINGIQNHEISTGDFVLVVTVNISLVQILWNFSHYIHDLAEVIGNVNQGLSIALAPIQIKDQDDAKPLQVTKGKVIFDSVKFHYKTANPLFDNLSIIIPPNQKVGLVGYSGSGKSTFVNLILRLYEVNEGKIIIDDDNIAEVTLESLRQAIAVIPQDPALFHRSIKENIGYSKPESSEEEIISAAKKAQAHQFIMQLSEGYNSLVGERGVKLSGGQRQRIAIARAFLKDPPLLILDEATSQLDSITEDLIQASLIELMNGKTTLIVAHRLSTLSHMDRIIVFDHGKIIEDGTHQQLLKLDGLYKHMWDMQVGGLLPDKKKDRDEF